jgi:hypothetical protein
MSSLPPPPNTPPVPNPSDGVAQPQARAARSWKTKHMVIATVLALVVGAVVGAAASGDESDPATLTTDTVGERQNAAESPAETDSGTFDTTSTGEVPATTRKPSDHSRANPAIVGQLVTLADRDNGNVELVVNAVDLDPYARLKQANDFNEPAPTGLQYVMVNVTATYRAGVEKQVLEDGLLFAVSMSVFGSAGVEHSSYESFVVAPEPLDQSADVLDGGSLTGNIVFLVEDGSPEILLRAEESWCFSNCDEAWFKLR